MKFIHLRIGVKDAVLAVDNVSLCNDTGDRCNPPGHSETCSRLISEVSETVKPSDISVRLTSLNFTTLNVRNLLSVPT